MKKFFAFIILFACMGCSSRIVDFTIISTKNVDLSKGASFERARTRTEGKDQAFIILFIPTGFPNMKEAIDKAIEKVPGCIALLDGVVYSKSFWIILFGKSSYIVEGTPLIDPALAQATNFPQYSVLKLDKNGEAIEFSEITEQEYASLKSKISKGSTKKHFNNSLMLH